MGVPQPSISLSLSLALFLSPSWGWVLSGPGGAESRCHVEERDGVAKLM